MGLSHDPLSQVTSLLTLGTEHNPRQEMFFCPQCKAGYFWPFAISPRTFSFYGYFALRFPTTCLLRNLYAGQEATVSTGHGTTDWFQIGKGVHQGCILSPCLFNLNAEYIMRNAGWMKHKLESTLPGEISITSDMQITSPLWQKEKRN